HLPLILFLFLSSPRAHPPLPPFPTRRSSDLVQRRRGRRAEVRRGVERRVLVVAVPVHQEPLVLAVLPLVGAPGEELEQVHFPRRSEEHTSELQSLTNLVCRLLLENNKPNHTL